MPLRAMVWLWPILSKMLITLTPSSLERVYQVLLQPIITANSLAMTNEF